MATEEKPKPEWFDPIVKMLDSNHVRIETVVKGPCFRGLVTFAPDGTIVGEDPIYLNQSELCEDRPLITIYDGYNG